MHCLFTEVKVDSPFFQLPILSEIEVYELLENDDLLENSNDTGQRLQALASYEEESEQNKDEIAIGQRGSEDLTNIATCMRNEHGKNDLITCHSENNSPHQGIIPTSTASAVSGTNNDDITLNNIEKRASKSYHFYIWRVIFSVPIYQCSKGV